MDMRRVFGGAVLFGLVWVAITYFQGKITDWRPLLAGFLVFVVLGPIVALVARFGIQWWKKRS